MGYIETNNVYTKKNNLFSNIHSTDYIDSERVKLKKIKKYKCKLQHRYENSDNK